MKEVMVLLGAYFVGGLIHNVLYWLWHLVPEEDWSAVAS